jgi:hypothetical protein
LAALACLVAILFLADITHDLAHAGPLEMAGTESFFQESSHSPEPAPEPVKNCCQPGCAHHFHGYPDRTPTAAMITALGSKLFSSDPALVCDRLRSLPLDTDRSPPLA